MLVEKILQKNDVNSLVSVVEFLCVNKLGLRGTFEKDPCDVEDIAVFF